MNLIPNLERSWRAIPPLGWLLLMTFGCLVPFLAKPVHVDDTLFVRAAQHIQHHPADFYGFALNWYGTTEPMVHDFDNPPLACYYMAGVAALAGWSEPVLHFAFLLPALAAAWGMFSLAKRYCSGPLLAAALAVVTPVFIISGTTLMCDILLLAFWVWAVVWFERGLEKTHWPSFVLSGCFAGLAFLTKYTGLALVPLLGAYGLMSQLGRGGWKQGLDAHRLLWVLTPMVTLVFFAGYEWSTERLYGRGLFLVSAADSLGLKAFDHAGPWAPGVVGLSFLGGCFLPVLFYAPALWSMRSLVRGLCLVLPLGLLCSFCAPFQRYVWPPEGHPNWLLLLQTILFVTGGVHLLVLAASETWCRRHNVQALLLVLWILGIVVFATVFNWTCNARSFLAMLPAVGLLLAWRLERRGSEQHLGRPSWRLCGPGLAAAAVTLFVAQADYNLAAANRTAAKDLCGKYSNSGRKLWFERHWGFQYYMERGGAQPLEIDLSQIQPGDLVVLSAEGCVDLPVDLVRVVDMLSYAPNILFSTDSLSSGAGFYVGGIEPFPFSLGHVNPQCFYVFEVVQSLAQAVKARGKSSPGNALAQQFDLERQALGWQQAIRSNPNDAEAHLKLAQFFASRSRTAAAAKHLAEVVRLRPEDVAARAELALLRQAQTAAAQPGQ